MLHFASGSSTSRRADNSSSNRPRSSLNATQTKSSSEPMFLAIEEELHDARRVQAHGQEEDLKIALGRVIERVSELSTQLQEAFKAKTELEMQLGLAKSNLQLVIANNEMLEDAIRHTNAQGDVGWRRGNSDSASLRRSDSLVRPRMSVEDISPGGSSAANSPSTGASPTNPPTPASAVGAKEDGRFFKFRFSGNNSSGGAGGSRPSTPSTTPASPAIGNSLGMHHGNSPSMPALGVVVPVEEREELAKLKKEVEQLRADLEKEKKEHKGTNEQKSALQSEMELLSEELFQEANKMVASERIKAHEIQQELAECRLEKQALQSALKIIDGENKALRTTASNSSLNIASGFATPSESPKLRPMDSSDDEGRSDEWSSKVPRLTHSRSSSNIGIKSRSASPETTAPPESPTIATPRKSRQEDLPMAVDITLPSSSEEDVAAIVKEALSDSASDSDSAIDLNLSSPSEPKSAITPTQPKSAVTAEPVDGGLSVISPRSPISPSLPEEESPWADTPASPRRSG